MKMPGIRKLPSRDKYSIQREKKYPDHARRGDPKFSKHLKLLISVYHLPRYLQIEIYWNTKSSLQIHSNTHFIITKQRGRLSKNRC